MTVGEDELDLVGVVNRRMDVLEALATPREKRDLVAALDLSRSTVDRAVRELETLGLVDRGDGYRLTATGQLVLEMVGSFLADLEDVAAARDVLAPVPPDAPLSPAMLRGADVEVAEPPSPTTALDPVVDLFDGAERVRGLSVAATRPGDAVRAIEEDTADGAHVEYVFSPEMLTYLEDEHADALASLREDGTFHTYRHGDLPYGLGLVTDGDDRHAFLATYGEDRSIRGVVLNDALEATLWAESVFEHYRDAATPVTVD